MADFSGDGSSRGSVSCFRDAALFNATLLRCETFWEPYSGPTESPRRETLRRRCIASQGSLIMGTYMADFFWRREQLHQCLLFQGRCVIQCFVHNGCGLFLDGVSDYSTASPAMGRCEHR